MILMIFFKVELPLTLEIPGPETLMFDTPLRQKVVSFFAEQMLAEQMLAEQMLAEQMLAEFVSIWDGFSQDVVELELLIRIPAKFVPKWIINLAT